VIKYLGSKRRLVPVLGELFEASGARDALDLFSGTTRVAQELKRRGAHVTAVDLARYSEVFARCYVETDAEAVDRDALAAAVAHLDALPGRPGYVTEVFCHEARFFQPHNGARIDAIRDEIADRWHGDPLEPILLTSLLEAADRVDSTTGVQMAYVKRWARRSANPLALRVPELLAGVGRAVRGDACALASTLGPVGFAYLDPPYNQHRYFTNYHIWETVVAWDAPPHYGVACKRADARDPATTTDFDRKRSLPGALRAVVADLDAAVVVLSGNDESWVGVDELLDLCAARGAVELLAVPSRRYVGAQIGIHNPAGERVGAVSHLHNTEYLLVAGEPGLVRRMAAAGASVPGVRQVRARRRPPRATAPAGPEPRSPGSRAGRRAG
jgi:adenine-specific DNA-methyltransferase